MPLGLTRKSKATTIEQDKSPYYTGEKDKRLLVHVMQGNIEVDKPIKTNIWKQQVEWRERVYPIDPTAFVVTNDGIHHQYVNANDTSAQRFNKPDDLLCKKCGGQASHPADARNVRALVKRGTIQAIWGIDSTHIILLMILGIGMLAMGGFAFYEYQDGQAKQVKIDSALASQSLKPLAPQGNAQNNQQETTVTVH